MELGHGVLMMLLFSVLLNVGIVEPQRVSLVDRLKALDKGIRQGLQRQKSADTSGTNSATDQQQGQDEVQHITIEEEKPTTLQQQVLSPEDTDGTSDVVRQLTASYEDDADDQVLDTETSKEGNLEMDDGSAETKKRPLIKPTKYHYYPHNQHLYLLPECATQQVCNAVYTRFNFTQPLCACADRFQGPCSASIARNDLHTIEVGLTKTGKSGRAFKSPTLVKTCEETKLIRDCRAPQDWALLALQNVRTGKSQYLVICRCDEGDLDGPMSHDQPAYARVPGIRVYGMMCNSGNVTSSRSGRTRPERSSDSITPEFPWEKVVEFSSSLDWN